MPLKHSKYASLRDPLQDPYATVKISKFRQFDDLTLDSLGSINLLVGKNNAGKTSILEALFLHACGYNANSALNNIIMRRQDMAGSSSRFEWGEKVLTCFNKSIERPLKFSITATFSGKSRPASLECSFIPTEEIAALRPSSYPKAIAGHSMAYRKVSDDDKDKVQSSDDFGEVDDDIVLPNRHYLGDWVTSIDRNAKTTRVYAPLAIQGYRQPLHLARWHSSQEFRNPDSSRVIFGELKRRSLLSQMSEILSEAFGQKIQLDSFPYPDGTQGPIYVIGDEKDPGSAELKDVEAAAGSKTKSSPIPSLLPLFVFGEGFQRFLYLLGQMIVYPQALHLIEDAETAFHQSMQGLLAKHLLAYVREFKTQVFITTHSADFLECFLGALYSEEAKVSHGGAPPNEVMVYKIRRGPKGHQEPWPLSGREAFEAIDSFRMDLR